MRPNLNHIAAISRLYNSPDAEAVTRTDLDWDWAVPLADPPGVATLAMRFTPSTQLPQMERLGDQLIIRGDFGPRNPVPFGTLLDPARFPIGAPPSEWGPGWTTAPSSVTPVATSDHILATVVNPAWQSGFAYNFPACRRLFATWETKFEPVSAEPGCSSYGPQWKVVRFNATKNANESTNNFEGETMLSGNTALFTDGQWRRTNLYAMIWPGSVHDYPARLRAYPPGEDEWLAGWPEDAYTETQWQVALEHSSAPDVRDGTFKLDWLQPFALRRWGVDWTGRVITWDGSVSGDRLVQPLTYTRVVWQNYWENCGDAARFKFAYLYVQPGSWARVVVGDHPDYAQCHWLVPLELTRWDNGGIEANIWRPMSGNVFVVREDGTVNSLGPLPI